MARRMNWKRHRRRRHARAVAPRWSAAEDREVTRLYYTMPAREIGVRLGRSGPAVATRAGKLGLVRSSRRAWTAPELRFLRRNYVRIGREATARELGVRPRRVEDKARELGLVAAQRTLRVKKQPLYKRFQLKPELRLWRERQPKKPRQFHHNPWRAEEIEFLRKNFRQMRHKAIGAALNRDTRSVTRMANNLGLRKRPMHRWTVEELRRFVRLRKQMSDTELAAAFGVSIYAINGVMQRLGTLQPRRRPVTADEREYVRSHHRRMSVKQMAVALRRDGSTIRGILADARLKPITARVARARSGSQ